MRIFVLGSTGMLGNYVASYFEGLKFKVIRVTRNDMDIENITSTGIGLWFELNGGLYIGDVVINCIGLIKQKMKEGGEVSAIKINSVFPHLLSTVCSEKHVELIHISTDGVFSGEGGNYTESTIARPIDIYGMTKLAGEPSNCAVIRSSLIGEGTSGVSLMEWALRTKDITGYTNHYWNGVTCLQMAKCIDEIIRGSLFWDGVRHYYSDPVTKAQLVRDITNIYETGAVVTDKDAEVAVNRVLSSDYEIFRQPPPIYKQIKEQKDWRK